MVNVRQFMVLNSKIFLVCVILKKKTQLAYQENLGDMNFFKIMLKTLTTSS